MAGITQGRILGQDCVLTLETAKVNWTDWELRMEKVQRDSRVAQSAADQFVEPYETCRLTVRGLRGYTETLTLSGLKALFDLQSITTVGGTDMPTNLIAQFGTPSLVELTATQPEDAGTYTAVVRFGKILHGFTAA